MKRPIVLFLFLAFTLAMAGCNESDVIAIQIQLRNDFSGTIIANHLMIPREGNPLERISSGVNWNSRVNLVFSAGTFEHLAKLKIEDLTFSGGTIPDGFHYVQVLLPRGTNIRWAKALVPLSAAERKKAAATFDPDKRLKDLGSAIKLRIDLPGPLVGHGVAPNIREISESAEKSRAELLIPVDTALSSGEPLKWHLTWQ